MMAVGDQAQRQQFIAAGLVKEIARLDGDIGSFAPAHVVARLKAKFADKKT